MNRQESSSSSSHNVEEEAASSMDGIQWDDGSGDDEDLGLIFWDDVAATVTAAVSSSGAPAAGNHAPQASFANGLGSWPSAGGANGPLPQQALLQHGAVNTALQDHGDASAIVWSGWNDAAAPGAAKDNFQGGGAVGRSMPPPPAAVPTLSGLDQAQAGGSMKNEGDKERGIPPADISLRGCGSTSLAPSSRQDNTAAMGGGVGINTPSQFMQNYQQQGMIMMQQQGQNPLVLQPKQQQQQGFPQLSSSLSTSVAAAPVGLGLPQQQNQAMFYQQLQALSAAATAAAAAASSSGGSGGGVAPVMPSQQHLLQALQLQQQSAAAIPWLQLQQQQQQAPQSQQQLQQQQQAMNAQLAYMALMQQQQQQQQFLPQMNMMMMMMMQQQQQQQSPVNVPTNTSLSSSSSSSPLKKSAAASFADDGGGSTTKKTKETKRSISDGDGVSARKRKKDTSSSSQDSKKSGDSSSASSSSSRQQKKQAKQQLTSIVRQVPPPPAAATTTAAVTPRSSSFPYPTGYPPQLFMTNAAAAAAAAYSQQQQVQVAAAMTGNNISRPSTTTPGMTGPTGLASSQQLKNRATTTTCPIVTSDTDGGYCTTEDAATITGTTSTSVNKSSSMKWSRPSNTAAPVAAPSSAAAVAAARAAMISSCDSATSDYDTSIISPALQQRHQRNLQNLAHERDLAAQEKLRTNRERNREHAKNTRLRKKAYVERLKITVDELCRERDTLVSERATSANLMVEIHSKRVDVLRSLFALRASYTVDQRRELWSSLLDECCFTSRVPVTPYQSFPSSEVQVSNCQRTIVGVDAMMNDVASNAVFLDSIVDRQRYPNGKIKFHYKLVTDETPVAGNQLMARWSMETLNAKQCGAHNELHQSGMLFCKFNSSHKIVSLEMMFDVMAFMLQVRMAMGYDNFNDVVIPNTVQACTKDFYYPVVMTSADRPYTITNVNERWEKLTGYKSEEVVGKASCSILQGDDTTKEELDLLMRPVLFKRPSCAMVTNYTKSGRRYRSYLTLYPLSTDSKISHYLGLTTFVHWIDREDETGKSRQTDDDDDDDKKCPGSTSPKNDLDNSNEASGGENPASSPSYAGSSIQGNKLDDGIKEISTTPPNNENEKQSLSSLTSSVSSNGSMSGGNLSDMAVVGAPSAATRKREDTSSANNDNVEMDKST